MAVKNAKTQCMIYPYWATVNKLRASAYFNCVVRDSGSEVRKTRKAVEFGSGSAKYSLSWIQTEKCSLTVDANIAFQHIG